MICSSNSSSSTFLQALSKCDVRSDVAEPPAHHCSKSILLQSRTEGHDLKPMRLGLGQRYGFRHYSFPCFTVTAGSSECVWGVWECVSHWLRSVSEVADLAESWCLTQLRHVHWSRTQAPRSCEPLLSVTRNGTGSRTQLVPVFWKICSEGELLADCTGIQVGVDLKLPTQRNLV